MLEGQTAVSHHNLVFQGAGSLLNSFEGPGAVSLRRVRQYDPHHAAALGLHGPGCSTWLISGLINDMLYSLFGLLRHLINLAVEIEGHRCL